MRDSVRRILLLGIFVLAAGMFFSGIQWGLPSRHFDEILFGHRTPWTGRHILDLAGDWETSGDRGADVAMHPLGKNGAPIMLNDTDQGRAQILRRYRLYSAQPDEMITFRSLSLMKPSQWDFDPRLYQYGGLWIYPVGIGLKLASLLKLVVLQRDLAFFLDHPNEFARYYVVARIYSAGWGLVGVGVVYLLATEWTQNRVAALLSSALYAVMPVVVNMAHEAKPHLPGAVLTLASIWAAMRFSKTEKTQYLLLAGALCGAAFAMVLSAAVAFVVLPVAVIAARGSLSRKCKIAIAAIAIGLAVFLVTNPYLPINLLLHRNVVYSNLSNSTHMYHAGLNVSALSNAIRLIAEGASPVLLLVAIAAMVYLVKGAQINSPGWVPGIPALIIFVQFVLLAGGKPAEYARFAVTVDILLALGAARAICAMPRFRNISAILVFTCTLFFGSRYVANFVVDSTNISHRQISADRIETMKGSSDVLAVWAEPAPYCLPPVDLFHWKITLLPPGMEGQSAAFGSTVVTVRPVEKPVPGADDPRWSLAPISWANKPFDITIPAR